MPKGTPARDDNSAEPAPAANTRRARRATGEVRKLILDAARTSFEQHGYPRSTTRDIADRAGVAEMLLFRNFGTKANLFAEAVLLPLVDLIRDWVDLIEPSTDADTENMERAFIEHLYRTASKNRGLLMSFFATRAFEPAVVEGHGADMMQAALDDIAIVSEQRLRRLGVDVSDMNVRLASRAGIGMVLAVALLDDWLLPGRDKPGADEIVDELTRQVLYGAFNEQSSGHIQLRRHKATRPGDA